MLKKYTPKDASLPLILPQTVFRREIYDPVSNLVNYVNVLFQEGYSAETLRQDLIDMYALDFYDSQVRNGGHSQFIHNSFEHRETGMERAARAAHMIGLPEMATMLDRCATFCRDNPDLADEQDGFGNRADVLDELDKTLFAFKYTYEDRTAYLDTLPPGHCDDLRDKFRFDGLDDNITAIVTEADRLLLTKTQEGAAKGAAKLARSFFKEKISKTRGPEPSEYKDRIVNDDIERLAAYIKIALRDSTPDERTENVTFQVRDKMLDPGLYDLSRYHIHAAAWIAQHPNLELVSSDEWKPRVEAITAASPFAMLEKRRRQLDRVTREMPGDVELAIAAAMANAAFSEDQCVFFEYHNLRLQLGPIYDSTFLGQTSDRSAVGLRTANGVVLRKLSDNWRHRLAWKSLKLAKRYGLVGRSSIPQWVSSIPAHVPGRPLSHVVLEPRRAELMQDLYVPEALMQWTDHPERMIYFRRGVLDTVDHDNQRLVYSFPMADAAHRMVACPEYVEFAAIGTGQPTRFFASTLAALRAELLRK